MDTPFPVTTGFNRAYILTARDSTPHGLRHESKKTVVSPHPLLTVTSAGRLKDAVRDVPHGMTFGLVAASVLAIFAADFALPADVRLHGLYVFPLAIVARYCAPLWQSITVLLMTTALQIIAFSTQPVSTPSLISDVVAPLAASVLIL